MNALWLTALLAVGTGTPIGPIIVKVVPVVEEKDVNSYVDATSQNEIGEIRLNVHLAPDAIEIGDFKQYSLRVMDHPVVSSKLDKEYWSRKAPVRQERFTKRFAAMVLKNEEVPNAYLALEFDNPKQESCDSVVYCIPIGLIKRVADEKSPMVAEPNQSAEPTTTPVTSPAGKEPR